MNGSTPSLAISIGLLVASSALGQTGVVAPPELLLVGVIVADNASDSVALVRRAGAARARALRIGEEMEGYVLVEVSKHFARLETRDREVVLVLPGQSPSAPFLKGLTGLAGVEAVAGEDQPSGEIWIRRSFSRQGARERLEKEIPVILSETDLSPYVEDGEIRGLGVTRLPDGTMMAESGLLPGDVLVSINGEPLRSVDSLWELLSRLVEEGEIRVLVRRKGEMLKLAYALTN